MLPGAVTEGAVRWDEVLDVAVGFAEDDLRDSDEVRPAMFAFRGEQPLFVAFVRPFPEGGYADPLIELFALAGGLRTDRLALSMPARAWSLEDPIPPVSDDGDLRQRVLAIELADGWRGRTRTTSILAPFDVLPDRSVRWGERQDMGKGESWIGDGVRLTVQQRARLRAPLREVRHQAERCAKLGHELIVAPEIAKRLLDASR